MRQRIHCGRPLDSSLDSWAVQYWLLSMPQTSLMVCQISSGQTAPAGVSRFSQKKSPDAGSSKGRTNSDSDPQTGRTTASSSS